MLMRHEDALEPVERFAHGREPSLQLLEAQAVVNQYLAGRPRHEHGVAATSTSEQRKSEHANLAFMLARGRGSERPRRGG